MHLGELDVVDSRINQRLDMSEQLLCVVLVQADDVLSSYVGYAMGGVQNRVSSFVRGCSRLGCGDRLD